MSALPLRRERCLSKHTRIVPLCLQKRVYWRWEVLPRNQWMWLVAMSSKSSLLGLSCFLRVSLQAWRVLASTHLFTCWCLSWRSENNRYLLHASTSRWDVPSVPTVGKWSPLCGRRYLQELRTGSNFQRKRNWGLLEWKCYSPLFCLLCKDW